MNNDAVYYLVDRSVLPGVFSKVMEAKKILERHPDKPVNEAVKEAGISRSAYYKYRDYIFPFYETSGGKIITLIFTVEDISGILSHIISEVSKAGANILTINQNIPINGLADITITIETQKMIRGIRDLLNDISGIKGVRRQEILARENR